MCADTIDRQAFEAAGVEIETARLVLRNPKPSDAAEMARLANDEGVVMMTSRMPYPYALADAETWIEAQLQRSTALPHAGFIIERKMDASLMGVVGYPVRASGQVAIGYWLGREYWGSGYATEAARAAVDLAFEMMPIECLIASCRVINTPSRRVLEKCGFGYTDSGLDPAPARGGAQVVDRFVLTRRQWLSLKAWRPASVRVVASV